MSSIAHEVTDCQEAEIPVETGPITRLVTWENELADLLAISFKNGTIDAEGADASIMDYEQWVIEVGSYMFDPEPSYFEDEVY